MMDVSMLHLFNDANGRIIYKPFDVFNKNTKSDQSDLVRFTR